MTNFKQETMELIGDHKIDEYKLEYMRDWYVSDNHSYTGKGEITWDEIPESELNYHSGLAISVGMVG